MDPVTNHPPTSSAARTFRAPSRIVRVMPSAPAAPRRVPPAPLGEDERNRALRVAERLHADLGRLVGGLPEHARAASGMSRYLGIVRNTCQRVVSALQDLDPTVATLAKLPGVKGLERFVEAARSRGVPGEDVDLAEVAVRQFDSLIADLAGSHAKLTARLGAGDPSAPASRSRAAERARADLFAAAANVTGRSCDVAISMYIFRTEHDAVLRALASGLIGATVLPGGMPVVLSAGDTLRWDEDESRRPRTLGAEQIKGRTSESLLTPFTTHPLPTVSGRGEPGSLLQVIDPSTLDGPERFDVVTALQSDNPRIDPETGKPTFDEIWNLVNCPAKHLIFDVYVHREMDREFRPSIDAQLWYPNLGSPGGDRWISRFPDQPRLELLGPGIERAFTPTYPRSLELAAYFFDRLGLDPVEFVGYRCETSYPIWRAGYCMRFEHLA